MPEYLTKDELLELTPGTRFRTTAGGEYTVRVKPERALNNGVVVVPTTSPRFGDPEGTIDVYIDPVDVPYHSVGMKTTNRGQTMESEPIRASLVRD